MNYYSESQEGFELGEGMKLRYKIDTKVDTRYKIQKLYF